MSNETSVINQEKALGSPAGGARRQLLTAQEVSDELRLPLSTVYHLAKSGVLPAVHLGRSWRFPSRDIAALSGEKRPGARILVVDDDATTRALVADVLESQGHLLMEAADAEAGFAAASTHHFDLLLIDFKLPKRNGGELIEQLKGYYSLNQMVIITAFADLAGMGKLLELGALTVLRKPLDPTQLIELVERLPYGDGENPQSIAKGAGRYSTKWEKMAYLKPNQSSHEPEGLSNNKAS